MRAWHDPAQNVNMKARHSFVSMNIDEGDWKKTTWRKEEEVEEVEEGEEAEEIE